MQAMTAVACQQEPGLMKDAAKLPDERTEGARSTASTSPTLSLTSSCPPALSLQEMHSLSQDSLTLPNAEEPDESSSESESEEREGLKLAVRRLVLSGARRCPPPKASTRALSEETTCDSESASEDSDEAVLRRASPFGGMCCMKLVDAELYMHGRLPVRCRRRSGRRVGTPAPRRAALSGPRARARARAHAHVLRRAGGCGG
eukprot:CAMPEP_0204568736 /NCGR_PEP_ID=MMETSP0661-20131031/37351_1 /ASSEMBLY_ACC=CAM_ASM_000606 /TAXON_ID=109239 /ORGANISM="Alexandrium margalefi, Strain AMGDE01CS-322" /LENGTH=202 /DNA_ID=CAMNT_0051576781 /DNA_START=44 /DNA_END=650 /DNA_ORIENTATION=-